MLNKNKFPKRSKIVKNSCIFATSKRNKNVDTKVTETKVPFKLNISWETQSVEWDMDTDSLANCSKSEYVRYLKGLFTNKERFMNRFIEPKLAKLEEVFRETPDMHNKEAIQVFCKACFDFLVEFYDDAVAFTYAEAFAIDNQQFRALVFSSINIGEMMANLNNKRLCVEGKDVKHKKYDENGKFIGMEDYHNIYEVHEMDGEDLGLREKLYAVKCWCTSTNKEHWLWIDAKFKNDPLNAIASTFKIHTNLIPYVKEAKRQGDILLYELTEDVKPEGEEVHLTKEQYFGWLTAQS
jgi:hypothetical protein